MDRRVAIGMPVRNGNPGIRRALDSLLSQTHRNISVLISDNCSTDNTREICAAYARRDSRVQLVAQKDNLGICNNFRFVLDASSAPFFMWACHDDRWAPTFVERNLDALIANPSAIAAMSKVDLVKEDGAVERAKGTAPLLGDPTARVQAVLRRPSEASRFYGVFRTGPLKQCFPDDIDVYGYDFIVLALAALRGEFIEVPEVLMEREAHDYLYYQRNIVAKKPSAYLRWCASRPMANKIREHARGRLGLSGRHALNMIELRQMAQYLLYHFPGLVQSARQVRSLGQAEALPGKDRPAKMRQASR